MTVRQKNSNFAVFTSAVPKHTKKKNKSIFYCACATPWGKRPTDETPWKEPHCLQHRFQVFFSVKYVVTVDDADERTPVALHVVELIIDCSNWSE